MRKNAQLSVRITEQEMTNLRELATRESVLLSQLIRGILAANAKQAGVTNLFRRLTATRPGPEQTGA
jgi:endonuclease III